MANRGAQMKQPVVYIMASRPNGVLYVGVTADLIRRVYEHRNALLDGFTKRYHVKTLVYCEQYDSMESAIQREKRLKKYKRQQKIALIEKENPDWRDLYKTLV